MLPAAPHRLPPPCPMETVALRAFVVEDNATLRECLIGTLSELTCVKAVGSAQAQAPAAHWLAQHPEGWDLLVVDLFLPDGSGLALVRQPGARQPWQKVIVLSNYVDAGIRKRCAQLGADAVFDKSTQLDQLVDYCAHLCFLRASAPGTTEPAGSGLA